MPIRKLISHFEKLGDLWRIADRLRSGVRFEQHNLMQDATALGEFDIVLCRHVLSCFDAHTRAATLERIAAVMAPDGVLLLGAGEGADMSDTFMASPQTGVFLRNAAARRAA